MDIQTLGEDYVIRQTSGDAPARTECYWCGKSNADGHMHDPWVRS